MFLAPEYTCKIGLYHSDFHPKSCSVPRIKYISNFYCYNSGKIPERMSFMRSRLTVQVVKSNTEQKLQTNWLRLFGNLFECASKTLLYILSVCFIHHVVHSVVDRVNDERNGQQSDRRGSPLAKRTLQFSRRESLFRDPTNSKNLPQREKNLTNNYKKKR